MNPVLIVVGCMVAFFGLVIIASGMFTVQQQERKIVERFGRFIAIAAPGLSFKVPVFDRIAGRVSHRVQELEISVESKTKDDVFVDLLIAVQYFIAESDEAVKAAFYRLSNPRQQISSYVFDTVRALVPDMSVDHVFQRER